MKTIINSFVEVSLDIKKTLDRMYNKPTWQPLDMRQANRIAQEYELYCFNTHMIYILPTSIEAMKLVYKFLLAVRRTAAHNKLKAFNMPIIYTIDNDNLRRIE